MARLHVELLARRQYRAPYDARTGDAVEDAEEGDDLHDAGAENRDARDQHDQVGKALPSIDEPLNQGVETSAEIPGQNSERDRYGER